MDKEQPQPLEVAQHLLNRMNELIRLHHLALLGPDRVLEFAYMDNWVRMHLPLAGQDVIQKRILAQRTFFEANQLADIRTTIPAGSVVIDAGANIGNHSLFFAMVCRARQVHAFEPMRVAYSTLARNIELNGLQDTIIAHNVAVGAQAGTADLLRYVEHNTGGTVLGLDQPGFYPVVPIDSLGLERCAFLKMDVEGGQIQALQGAAETLARCKPLIWVELRSKRTEFEDGNAKMQSMGYKLLRQVANSPDDFLFGPA
jgi:FkbM family methyltransferase